MLDKLKAKEQRYRELEGNLADQDLMADQKRYQKLAKEYSDLTEIVNLSKEYSGCMSRVLESEQVLEKESDPELIELAKSELEDLQTQMEVLEQKINEILNPKKKERDRDLIIEIRAGTGGQEASLFAADLYRMYCKYADLKGWTAENISSNESETGGFKEVIFSITGHGAEKHLKWESGAHRVQRVPTTEASGRIHTSAATVAVLFEPEEVDVEIKPEDIKVDVFRSSGPGGQSVNTTDSAIRITHLPMGIVVICQDERSQLKNKYKAMRVLRARLMDKIQQDHMEKESQDRKLKVGSGDRSEKIRTYNYPDRRVTDHRIGFTTHKLNNIMNGDLDEIMGALIKAEEEESLE